MDITEKKVEMDIQERISSLPEEIKEIVTLGFFDDVMDEIVQLFHVTKRQRALLENETLLVILFFSSKEEFPKNLQTALEIDNEKALAISTYVQKELFSLIDNFFEIDETTTIQSNPLEVDLQPQNDIEPDKRFINEGETENQSTETQSGQEEQRIAEPTPSDPNDISPLRTMKTDAERASTGEQKEKPKNSVVELPRYVQEENENT